MASLLSRPDINGAIALATCNRFELYLDVEGFHTAVDATVAAIAQSPDTHPGLRDAIVVYAAEGVVEHLFEVASGLDSMVVGEVEIIGQVREALAGSDEHITPTLRRLFQHALTTSKAVISQTGLGAAGRSLASVGLDLAEARVGIWSGATALVIGTGSYARVVVADLQRRGCTAIGVFSRSGNAEQFGLSHGTSAIPTDGLQAAITAADLVITCSGTGEAVLQPELFTLTGQILPVVDLSGGADVAPSLEHLPSIDLITLDRIGQLAPLEHSAALLTARELVSKAVSAFQHLEGGRMASPAVTAMRAHVSRIIEQEIEATSARYSPETADAVARSLRRVSGSLLHAPSVRAAELARTGDLDDYRRALHTLFGIVVDAS